MKILLLEDDILLNEAITKYLTTIGHAITSARDGDVCLEILEKVKFDLLIFDINVPNIDGLSILEILHTQKKIMPVILSRPSLISKIYQELLNWDAMII